MSFDNPSNRGRALKIIDILGHVEKSAKSNRASAEDVADMLAPVIDRLRQIGALPPEGGAAGPGWDEARAMHEASRAALGREAAALSAAHLAEDRSAAPYAPGERQAVAEIPEATPAPETPLSAATVPGGRWSADRNAPARAIIHDAARCAPLPDLAHAVAVLATRIDEALDDLAGAGR